MANFKKELENLINKYSMENASDTPDFILTGYLIGCLENLDKIIQTRENWYGREINELKERAMSLPKACKPAKTAEEIAQDFIVEATIINFNNDIAYANSDVIPNKVTPEELLEDSDLSFKVYKQVKDILSQRAQSEKSELSPNDLRFHGNDTVILGGRKFHLVPTGKDWEISLICATNTPPMSHNGKTIPPNYRILRITTISQTAAYKTTEDFDIGTKIQEGIIESFRLTGGYPQAVILGTGGLVDVDNFRKV